MASMVNANLWVNTIKLDFDLNAAFKYIFVHKHLSLLISFALGLCINENAVQFHFPAHFFHNRSANEIDAGITYNITRKYKYALK